MLNLMLRIVGTVNIIIFSQFRRLLVVLCTLALQVCPPANAEFDAYDQFFNSSREEIVTLLNNFKEAVKAKDVKGFASMLQQKPDYYYFGPTKEDILSDFNKAIPIDVQHLLLHLELDDASISWSGVQFSYPDGGLLLSFYPDCNRKTGKCDAMNIGDLRTPGVLAAHEAAENKKWEAAAARLTLVDLNKIEAVKRFLQGNWRISDSYACGIYSGGAEDDADSVIGERVSIKDNEIKIPVSAHYWIKTNDSTTHERYSAGKQSCVIYSTEKVILSDQCRHNLGYVINSAALQINFNCEEPDNLKEGDISMDTRSLLLADEGNVVLLSVWEIYVALRR